MTHNLKKLFRPKKRYLTVLLVLLMLLLIAVLELTNTTYIFHKRPQPLTTGQNTQGQPLAPSSKGQTNTQTQTTVSAQSNSKIDTTTIALIAPFGNFVSAHHVTMSTAIASVCNTTSGATCVINFSSNNVTKSLSTEMTDSEGAVYWNNWTPKSIGLTTGSWQIQAVATLNGQTKTANDALSLEVSL